MKTTGMGLVLFIALVFGSSALANCIALESGVPLTEVAGELDGHGCFVGREDAHVDWVLSRGNLDSRNVLVALEAAGEATLTLLNDADQELAQLTASEGRAEADWVLTEGRFRFRVETGPGERFVVSTRTGDSRTSIESDHRAGINPTGTRAAFGSTGWLHESPWNVRWNLREDDGGEWDILLTPGPGVPLNVKLFAQDGTLLQHVTGEPGEARRLPPTTYEPGDYTFVTAQAGWSGAAMRIDASALGPDTSSGAKTGRVGSLAQAGRISLDGVRGNLIEDSRDWFRLDLTPAEAGIYDIVLNNQEEFDLCVVSEFTVELACFRGQDLVAHGIRLEEGITYVSVSGHRPNEPEYHLQFEPVTPARAQVIGPAGTAASAYLMEDGAARVTLESRTTTWLAFDAPEAGLYRVQLQGPDTVHLVAYDGGLSTLRRYSPRNEQVLRLDNLPFREGRNYVSLDARAGDYAVRVLHVGPLPEPHVPTEAAAATEEVAARPEGVVVPSINDTSGTAAELRPGLPYAATSLPGDQTSYYRFSLLNEAMVRFTLTPPEDSVMRLTAPGASQVVGSEPGAPVIADAWLPAGDYQVQTRVIDGSTDWYTLEWELLDPFVRTGGLYVPPSENPLPVPGSLLVSHGQPLPDFAYHRLPEVTEPARLTVSTPEDAGHDLRLYDAENNVLQPAEDEDGRRVYDLLPGTHVLRLAPGMVWDVSLEFSNGPTPVTSNLADDVHIEFEVDAEAVAAWSIWGQSVDGQLRVRNEGDSDYVLDVLSHATDPRVSFPHAGETIELPAGGTLELPIEITLPADLFGEVPLSLSYGLEDGSGQSVSARADLLPLCEAGLVGGHSWWPVTEALLGYLNVAWQPLGTSLVDNSSSDLAILDGRISPSNPPTRALGHEYTVDLGAERELVAAALHPVGSGTGFERLSDFQIAVSDDAESWTVVLEDRLSSAHMEQFFEFDQPVVTRYARLTTLSSQVSNRQAGIGEFKLLTRDIPGQFNIAAEALGGHVVSSSPLIGNGSPILQDPEYGGDPRRTTVSVRAGEALPGWTIGFHNNRAARISSFEWHDNDQEQNISQLRIMVSTESPLGPWEELSDWQLDRQDGQAVLQLDEPVWARFVQFEVIGDVPERNMTVQLPLLLRILEAEDYSSILGEWGIDSSWSAYEYSNPELFTETTIEFGSNSDRANALLLEASETGYVQTGIAESWYRVVMPEDMNLALLEIHSEPGVVLGYELFDADGNVSASGISEGDSLRLSGQPGTEWQLRVFEPPRSVLFAWDTSGSVNPYQNQIYAALERFAGAMRGDLESIMLLAFARTPNFLLPEWSSDPDEVSRTLNEYDRRDDSSDAQQHLAAAASALSGRDGVRAIVFITDAESGGYGLTQEVWSHLGESGAQVYSLEVSTAGGARPQDLMQDWASANGGHYVNATSLAQLEQGFARADCLIRRAKYHEVTVEFQEREAIPGTLTVTRPETADGNSGAAMSADSGILVIMDASGSMYRTLDGRYRYEIAKDVLANLVTEVLPAESPFALRVFGNRAANICRSDLEVGLAPLDAGAVSAVIAGIEPQPFAGTPIADSLQAAAGDLAAASGQRTVILITDGEESCDGDVAAAISDLRSAGFDVTLNIIGFDFDADDVDAARQQFQGWAELGGGQYFDANSADELAGALASSVALPYEVLDADGNLVGRGNVNGFALDLEGGVYTVRVLAEEPVVFTDVTVDGEPVTLSLD